MTTRQDLLEALQTLISPIAKNTYNIPTRILLAPEKIVIKLPVTNDSLALKAFDRTKSDCLLQLSIPFNREPKGMYEVYLNSAKRDSVNLLGIMRFFGAAHMQPEGRPVTKTFNFKVRDWIDLANFSGKLDLLVMPKGRYRDTIGSVKPFWHRGGQSRTRCFEPR